MNLQDLPIELRQKLAKIYALVEGGKTEGEKKAARAALDRVLAKHDLRLENFTELSQEKRWFRYSNIMELDLLLLRKKLFPLADSKCIRKRDVVRNVALRIIGYLLNYPDYVTLDSAYEYFRSHMKRQFRKHADAQYQKFKKKGNKKGAEYVRQVFFSKYVVESDLHVPHEDARETFRRELLERNPQTKEEAQERADRLKAHLAMQKVQGGTFYKQVSSAPAIAQIEG